MKKLIAHEYSSGERHATTILNTESLESVFFIHSGFESDIVSALAGLGVGSLVVHETELSSDRFNDATKTAIPWSGSEFHKGWLALVVEADEWLEKNWKRG